MNKVFVLVCILMGVTSCSDFLSEEPIGYIDQNKFLETEDDFDRAMYSVYNTLNSQGLYGRYWPVIDVGTDDVGTVASQTGMHNFASYALSGDQEWFSKSGVWDALWQGINRANYIIDSINEKEDLTVEYRNSTMAEAMCLRAFFYFHLVRAWGDVPLVKWFVYNDNYDFTSELERQPVEVIYNEVIFPDLVFASNYAPDYQSQKGRVTKWFALTLLSEAYATFAGYRRNSLTGEIVKGNDSYWLLARNAAEKVIDSEDCPFSLNEEGDNPYAVAWNQNFTDESLLEVGAISSIGVGSWLTRDCWSSRTGSPFWGATTAKPFDNGLQVSQMGFPGITNQGKFIPSPDLYHAMEPGDLRSWGIMTKFQESGSGGNIYLCQPTFTKYVDINVALGKLGTSFQYADRNFVIYRYVDAMLLFAEADNEVNGPTQKSIGIINKIRNRAGLVDMTDDKYANKESFRETIRKERRIELHAECKRRFDLIRWNTFKKETRDMDVKWLMADNMNTDTGKSYMNVDCQIIYVPSTPSVGCETVTEAPELFYLLPIPTKELSKTGWYNNYGY